MSTGACGINCTTCRLHVLGVCSTCGAGNSNEGREKLAAQHRLFGFGCPILSCAVGRGIGYCLRDCDDFPCDVLMDSEYPFSAAFLMMQSRRRQNVDSPQAAWPERTPELWERLSEKSAGELCTNSGAFLFNDLYRLRSLNELWEIDVQARSIVKVEGAFGGEWDRQLPFLLLMYLVYAQESSLSGEMVAPRELTAGGDFFQGRYSLQTEELEEAFGKDAGKFSARAEELGAVRIDKSDCAVRLQVFPKVVVEYLLWLADDEFPARVKVLMDRESLVHFPPDTMSIMVNLLTGRILASLR